MLNTPVLFTVFNRYDNTRIVFNAIRNAKPRQLFIAADGPRPSKIGEKEKCEEVREYILSSVDWECEVYTLFREENLGSGKAIYQAINWFFLHVNKGIILEDDCLPDNTFFNFAEEMLNYYEHEEQIMHISGSSLQCGLKRGKASYYFSSISTTWGWATWKRAWDKYSFDFFSDSDEEIINILKQASLSSTDAMEFLHEFHKAKNHEIDAWDYQWLYTVMRNNGICIVPRYNLIRNLGFHSQGTHTFSAPHWYKYLVDKPIENIVFADEIEVNKKADFFYMSLIMGKRTTEVVYIKIINKIKQFI